MDILDNPILCKTCGRKMKKGILNKNGFNLRAVKCEKCNSIIYHPTDKQEYENFIRLKQKEYNVKMRMVGNSYAVSIPREIVDFMQDQENIMSSMVKLCFEEAGRISLMFNKPEENSRVIKAREIKIIKNNKPVFHARELRDSANPKNNQTKIYKSEKDEKEEEL